MRYSRPTLGATSRQRTHVSVACVHARCAGGGGAATGDRGRDQKHENTLHRGWRFFHDADAAAACSKRLRSWREKWGGGKGGKRGGRQTTKQTGRGFAGTPPPLPASTHQRRCTFQLARCLAGGPAVGKGGTVRETRWGGRPPHCPPSPPPPLSLHGPPAARARHDSASARCSGRGVAPAPLWPGGRSPVVDRHRDPVRRFQGQHAAGGQGQELEGVGQAAHG